MVEFADELIEVFVYPDGEQYHEPPVWKSDDYEIRHTTLCDECEEEYQIVWGEPEAECGCDCGIIDWEY